MSQDEPRKHRDISRHAFLLSSLGFVTSGAALAIAASGSPPSSGGGGSGDTITSPNSTLGVGGTSTNTTLDINLSNPNVWGALQTFGNNISIGGYGALDVTSPAAGDILYYNGFNLVNLPIGSPGYVLTASAGGEPEWLGAPAGAVTSVANSDGTLTISPTTGDVVASLALSHANIWTQAQTFPSASLTNTELVGPLVSGLTSENGLTATTPLGVGSAYYTLVLNGTTLSLGSSGLSLNLTNANVWTGLQEFTNGDLAILGSGVGYTLLESGLSGLLNNTLTFPTTASDTIAAIGTAQSWGALQTFGNNISIGGVAFNVSGTAKGDIIYNSGTYWENLAIGGTAGYVLTVASGLPSWAVLPASAVTSVANSDGTLTISPTTGDVVASLALGHANVWSGAQTFDSSDLLLNNPAGTYAYTFVGAALAASHNITLPLLTLSDTMAVLGFAQSWSALQTFGNYISFGTLPVNVGTPPTAGEVLGVDGTATHWAPLSVVNSFDTLTGAVTTSSPNSTLSLTTTLQNRNFDLNLNTANVWVGAQTGNIAASSATFGYVSSFATKTGAITLGSGLSMSSNELDVTFPTVVTSLATKTGAITLGSGLSMSSNELDVTFPSQEWTAGAVATVGDGLSILGTELISSWQTTTVTGLSSGLSNVGGTLTVTFPTVVTSLDSLTGAITTGSPNSTLTIGTSSQERTFDINLSHINTWIAAQTFTNADFILKGTSTGVTTLNSGLISTSSNTLTLPITATDTLAALATAQTWAALQKFTNADFALLGSSTGYTLLESGLGSTSNNTLTLPITASDTLAALGTVQTWSATQTMQQIDPSVDNTYSLGSTTLEWSAVYAHGLGIPINTVNSGLVGYWPFDEGSGTLAYDLSGNQNTGILTNTPTWAAGYFGSGLSFTSASSKYVSVASTTSLNPSAITMAAWINPATTVNSQILGKGYQYMFDAVAITYTKLEFTLRLTSNGSFSTGSNSYLPPTSTWTHLVGTYDGTTMRFYVNGALLSSRAVTDTIVTNTNTFLIGSCGGTWGTSYFSGVIDDVRIYNRALSAAEVLNLYNSYPINPYLNNFPTFNLAPTGTTTALLATANSPATTGTAPYAWLQTKAPDGSTVYIPAWK